MWFFVGLCGALLCLTAVFLYLLMRTLKCLRNIYYFEGFELPIESKVTQSGRFTVNVRRFCHWVGGFVYVEPQFQVPPEMHVVLQVLFVVILLVCDYAVEAVSPCSSAFCLSSFIISFSVAVSLSLLIDFSLEKAFILSLNPSHRLPANDYLISTEQISTFPMETDLIPSPFPLSDLLKPTAHRPLPGDDQDNTSHAPKMNFSVDFLLVGVVIGVNLGCFWLIYEVKEMDLEVIWVNLGVGVVVDVPVRVLFSAVLTLFGGVLDPWRGYKRLGYCIKWKDLHKYRHLPRKSRESSVDAVQEVSEIVEEVHYPSSAGDTQRLALSLSAVCSHRDSNESGYLVSVHSESVAVDEPELPSSPPPVPAIPHLPSNPPTSRPAKFPVPPSSSPYLPSSTDLLPPIPPRFTSTPEPSPSSFSLDEFPIPPAFARFSDIEGSESDFEEPQIPTSAPVKRNGRSKSLFEALYGKPGVFGHGEPIETLRKSRTRSPKRVRKRKRLEEIVSENEEENGGKRTNSPEAAESTRYQTPASPRRALTQLHRPDSSPRPAFTTPSANQLTFNRGRSMNPIEPDFEVFIRPDSPEAADSVNFSVSEHTNVSHTRSQHRLRSRLRMGRTEEYYDSPYQEILWRRIPEKHRKGKVLPVLSRSKSPTNSLHTAGKVVRPWY